MKRVGWSAVIYEMLALAWGVYFTVHFRVPWYDVVALMVINAAAGSAFVQAIIP